MFCSCSSRPISFCSPRVKTWQVARVVRLPMAPVGELRGLIYRTSRVPGEEPKNYVHFFNDKQLPALVANPEGTSLYIVGGNYRVKPSGIHG